MGGFELRGRLHLWAAALLESELLLRDAARVRGARDAVSMDAAPTASSPFGGWHDLDAAHERFTVLAVVFFCQMFNVGYKAERIAAGNLETAVNDERKRILAATFPTSAEREAFKQLLKTLEDARDGMFAHADGRNFDIEHTPFTVISDTHYECLNRIDVSAWRDAIRKLHHEVTRRLRDLGVDSRITSHAIKAS